MFREHPVLVSTGMPAPKQWQTIGDTFVVVWDDSHESYYPLETLRRACPCAACSGEPDLFGRMARGPAPRYTPASFQLRNAVQVGNYALQPNWMDGHEHGMWTYDRLRDFCSCDACQDSSKVKSAAE